MWNSRLVLHGFVIDFHLVSAGDIIYQITRSSKSFLYQGCLLWDAVANRMLNPSLLFELRTDSNPKSAPGK